MSGMDNDAQLPASRPRQVVATLIDVALAGAVAWSLRRRANVRVLRWLRLLPAEAVREQLRTPGQRLLGIATVDARTGRRVAPWRTLVLLAVAAAGHALSARVRGREDADAGRRREAVRRDLDEIARGHADDRAARQAAMQRSFSEHKPPSVYPGLLRAITPALAVSTLNRRLRRRLAPTRQVRGSGSPPHSP
jgi:hypothetical protein